MLPRVPGTRLHHRGSAPFEASKLIGAHNKAACGTVKTARATTLKRLLFAADFTDRAFWRENVNMAVLRGTGGKGRGRGGGGSFEAVCGGHRAVATRRRPGQASPGRPAERAAVTGDSRSHPSFDREREWGGGNQGGN